MKLKVIYDDATPIKIERPPTLTESFVAFKMHGSTAVWDGQDATDITEVVTAVEDLPFVQGVSMEEL